MVFDSPPDPMNHVHIFKGHPRQFALWELVLHWHKTFPPDQMDQVEIPSHSYTKLKKLDVQEGKRQALRRSCERETHTYKASKLGPVERWWTQDGKLGITIQDPPPESERRTRLLYFTYSYCILSRV